jgi:hypothetical protein
MVLADCCMPWCQVGDTKAAMGRWRPPWLKRVSGANFGSVLCAVCVEAITVVTENRLRSIITSEVQSKMIFMGHRISSYHVPIIRSFFIFPKTLLSSQNLLYDHLPIHTYITFQYPSQKVTLFCLTIHLVMTQYQLLLSQKVTLLCPIIYLDVT